MPSSSRSQAVLNSRKGFPSSVKKKGKQAQSSASATASASRVIQPKRRRKEEKELSLKKSASQDLGKNVHRDQNESFVLPNSRYWVADLTPHDRSEEKWPEIEHIFLAESPHISEVEPEDTQERRPLCGAAGKKWWEKLGLLVQGTPVEDLSANSLIAFCKKHRIAVMNSVQYPLDAKVATRFPEAEPVANLGFQKAGAGSNFRKLRDSRSVLHFVEVLHSRLVSVGLEKAEIHCLGNDAEWFLERVLQKDPSLAARVGVKVPHPSAWWRKGGSFGKVADKNLKKIFTSGSRS